MTTAQAQGVPDYQSAFAAVFGQGMWTMAGSLVAFMLGPEAGWIHGSIFFIDGGNDAEIRPDRY